jgi:hypothetical protein
MPMQLQIKWQRWLWMRGKSGLYANVFFQYLYSGFQDQKRHVAGK